MSANSCHASQSFKLFSRYLFKSLMIEVPCALIKLVLSIKLVFFFSLHYLINPVDLNNCLVKENIQYHPKPL
jgi:hypothetical protein